MKEPSNLEVEVTHLIQELLEATRLELTYTVQLNPGATPELTVEFSGPDTPMLLSRNGELLQAIEHLGSQVSRLEPEEHDRLRMDAGRFKAKRDADLLRSAELAALQVRETGRPYTFRPMSSHERRRLHLVLNASGLHTESTGEGPQRAVVVHPPAKQQA